MSRKQCYVICIDAFPELDTLKEKLVGFQRADLVCAGAFTTATMTSIVCSTRPSDVIPGGIGADTSYMPKFLDWRTSGKALFDKVLNGGKEVIIHNHVPWMSRNLHGTNLTKEQTTQHYRDHKASDDGVDVLEDYAVVRKDGKLTYSSTHPDLTLNTFLEWGISSRKDSFYRNEKQYLQNLQFDGVLWTDLCHFHEHIFYGHGNPWCDATKGITINREDALHDSIEWLSSFDLSDPNSMFIIYADHGHRVENHLAPIDYITWCYFKDNTSDRMIRPVISSYDLYPLILDFLEIPYELTGFRAELPTLEYHPDRVYYTEDGRATAIDRKIATNYTQTRLVDDQWVSVTHVIPGANIPLGWYLKIAEKSKLSYKMYYLPDDTNLPPGVALDLRSQVGGPQGPLTRLPVGNLPPETMTNVEYDGPLGTIDKKDSAYVAPAEHLLNVARELGWPA